MAGLFVITRTGDVECCDMDDNFAEEDIQSILTYLKHHEPENANRLFAIEVLRVLQTIAKDLVRKDLPQAELIAEALRIKKGES